MFSQRFAKAVEPGRLCDNRQRKLHFESQLQFHHKRDRFERIAAGFEEIVFRAANRRLQDFLPDLSDGAPDAIVGSGFGCRAFALDRGFVQSMRAL